MIIFTASFIILDKWLEMVDMRLNFVDKWLEMSDETKFCLMLGYIRGSFYLVEPMNLNFMPDWYVDGLDLGWNHGVSICGWWIHFVWDL